MTRFYLDEVTNRKLKQPPHELNIRVVECNWANQPRCCQWDLVHPHLPQKWDAACSCISGNYKAAYSFALQHGIMEIIPRISKEPFSFAMLSFAVTLSKSNVCPMR
jgi:hypothetical protein